MKTPQLKIVVALLCATPPLVFAATDNVLDEIVVTATRVAQPLGHTIPHTSVINEQEIRKSGAPDVPSLLRSLSGIEVVQSGGLGNVSSTFMRGTNSSHVLVLLDGVRINSATTGTTALEHIMLDSIERIEVVRGNVSSLYGSEAIGGVIQLFSKHGHGAPAFNVSAGLGSHGTQRLAAGFSGDVHDTSFSVSAGKAKTDGVSAINPLLAPNANPNNNSYDNNTINAQIKHTLNADHSLSATLFSTRGKSSYDSAYGLPTDIYNTQAGIDKLSLSSDDQLSDMWHSKLNLARGTDDSRDYKNSVQQSRLRTTSDQLAWQNELSITDNQKINLSLEQLGQSISVEDIFTPNPYTKTQRTVNSMLAGYVGEYGAQQVQLNLRQDRYSDFGTANTGLLGYGLSFADNWRATASVSNAFKAPTFNDLYRPSWGGNPNLLPEQANSREIGLRYGSNGQYFGLTHFDNRIHNLISFPAPLYVGQNIDRARITGQELSYSGEFGSSHLKANATFQDPRNTATGLVLSRRAKEFGSVAASHDLAALNLGAELRYSGVRQDGVHTLSSYALLNLTARYNIDKHLNLSARVDNLFKRDYSEAYSYNTLGRTLFVSVNYRQ